MLNDESKIHCQNPTKEDHCILHHNTNLSIKLELEGFFSIFDTRKSNVQDFQEGVCVEIPHVNQCVEILSWYSIPPDSF